MRDALERIFADHQQRMDEINEDFRLSMLAAIDSAVDQSFKWITIVCFACAGVAAGALVVIEGLQ